MKTTQHAQDGSLFSVALVIRADEVRVGDGLIGGARFPSDPPEPWLVTKAVRSGNDRSRRRIEVGFRSVVLPNDALVIVQGRNCA